MRSSVRAVLRPELVVSLVPGALVALAMLSALGIAAPARAQDRPEAPPSEVAPDDPPVDRAPEPDRADAPAADARGTALAPPSTAASFATIETVEPGVLVIPEPPEAAPTEPTEGRALARPAADRAAGERLLRNLDAAERALAHDRGSADLEMAVAVNLYVGGVLLSILSASLIIGTIFEAACVNGVVEECLDGPDFVIGAIPATIGAAALLFGAVSTERSAASYHRALDGRRDELEDRRDRIAERFSLALGPGSAAARLTF